MPPILVDTGPLYAMADRDDDWHVRVVKFVKGSTLPETRSARCA